MNRDPVHFALCNMILFMAFKFIDSFSFLYTQISLKPRPNGRKRKHCWSTTSNIARCYMLSAFAHPVASCCMLLESYANFEIGQTSSYVKTQHCCHLLANNCWELLACSVCTYSFTNTRRMHGKGSGMGTLGLISFKRIIRFFWNPAFPLALLRLCCPKPIPDGKLKTLSRRECWGRTFIRKFDWSWVLWKTKLTAVSIISCYS